ncbi:MAG: chromosome partitioning protein [Propionibacteriales bacterium]|nr:chromosome partitioning protein [Propionibacteriales bacterium]
MAIPVLLAMSGSSLESSVVVALQRPARGGVEIVRRCVDMADLVAVAAAGQARAALVAADVPDLDADVVAQLRECHVVPVGLVEDDDPPATHRLHQMGMSAVLDATDIDALPERIAEALARAETEDAAVPEPGPPAEGTPFDGTLRGTGRIIAVWGPSGAPGRTTVAVGLASELAALGAPTLLVDADVFGGSIAQHLALLDESSGILAAARSAKAGTLDAAALAGHAREINPSLRVVTGLPRGDRWPELSPVAASAVITAARGLAAFSVIDCGFSLETDEELSFDTAPPRRNGATLRILEQSDLILTVGAADPVGLARVARGYVDLTEMVPGVPVRVLVNRMRASLGWSKAEVTAMVTRFTGHQRVDVLPDDRVACDEALVHGRTLTECAPRSALRLALRDLVMDLAGVSGRRSVRRTRIRRKPAPR